jgi:hypothetical protein
VKWVIAILVVAAAAIGGFVLLRHPGSSKTEVRLVEPFTPVGLTNGFHQSKSVRGQCQPSNLDFGRDDAWRCFTSPGSEILDPCFADPYMPAPGVILACPRDPWTTAAVIVRPTGTLDQGGVQRPALSRIGPWAFELANGQRCVLVGGATTTIAGMRVNYGCDGGDVVGNPDRSRPIWRAFYATKGSASLVQVDIRVTWY